MLEQLPETQRRAILLREWQGLSYREIAAELELSQGAVETLIFRARARSRAASSSRRRRSAGRVRALDWGNLVAGLKTALLGGSAAAKVAATVAVVSATTVVAAQIRFNISATGAGRPKTHARPGCAPSARHALDALRRQAGAQAVGRAVGCALGRPQDRGPRRARRPPAPGQDARPRVGSAGTPRGTPAHAAKPAARTHAQPRASRRAQPAPGTPPSQARPGQGANAHSSSQEQGKS